MMESRTDGRDPSDVAGRLTRSPGSVLTMGVLALIAGVAILVWPHATVKVIAVVFGIFALINGVYGLVSAIAGDERTSGTRVLLAFSGVLSLGVGILVLRHPFQTMTVLTVLLGLFWVIGGVIGLVHALASRSMPGRAWAAGAGAVTAIAGVVLLAYPSVSLTVLVWLLGLELLISGAGVVGWGVAARRELRSDARVGAPHPRARHA
ncbi:HdeD family acid-resistance protein [Amycolatopsis sp. K13G38]|uniref:HdeD family acid-resistance protein n=1 Tax=Amycolatopsis acididurans TaxID=2724524 RepID=A0ABX1IXU5_9PSEU|nr:HdeD family acid-resistance protein [Amycolatopsis acididurans]NKQ52326.1 HdeD family acid-resistance protein [Amycolatopsis acididurans]